MKPPIERAYRYAASVAVAYAVRFPWLEDDIKQAAMIGAWKAWRDFREDGGTSFQAYVRKRSLGAIVDEIRKQSAVDTHCGRAEAPQFEGLPDVVGDDLPVGWELEAEDAVRAMTSGLLTRERTLILNVFLNAATPDAAAAGRVFGLSGSWASVQVKRALEKLRRS